MERRRHRRFTKRLETRFKSGGMNFTGISSNLSETGLFIRTKRSFAPDSILDIELVMPNGRLSFLKGIVKWTVKTAISSFKNGMGVEIIEKDASYVDFVKSFNEKAGIFSEEKLAQEFHVVVCPKCGAKNKVMYNKISLGPKCGKCKTPLMITVS